MAVPQVDERLGHVEVRQARLESALESVVKEVSKLSGWMEKFDAHLQRSGKTNWGNLIAAAALLVSVLVAFGGMYIKPIQMATQSNSQAIERIDVNTADQLKEASNRFLRLENEVDVLENNVIRMETEARLGQKP